MKKTEKEKAITLRKQGKTYNEILKEIPVAKSTLSLWLRGVGMANAQKQRITEKRKVAQLKGAKARRDERVRSSNEIFERSEKQVGIISPRELWLMGTMLYWAEGSKEKEWRIGGRIQFGNTDPFMMKMFVSWLFSTFNTTPDDLVFDIYIHKNSEHRIEEVMSFWKGAVGDSLREISNVYYKKHNPKTNRKNIGNVYNGVLRVTVKTSTNKLRQIAGWTRGVYKNVAYCGIV